MLSRVAACGYITVAASVTTCCRCAVWKKILIFGNARSGFWLLTLCWVHTSCEKRLMCRVAKRVCARVCSHWSYNVRSNMYIDTNAKESNILFSLLMHFILNICGSAAIENVLGLIFIVPMLFVFECNVVLGSGVLVNSVEKTSWMKLEQKTCVFINIGMYWK